MVGLDVFHRLVIIIVYIVIDIPSIKLTDLCGIFRPSYAALPGKEILNFYYVYFWTFCIAAVPSRILIVYLYQSGMTISLNVYNLITLSFV